MLLRKTHKKKRDLEALGGLSDATSVAADVSYTYNHPTIDINGPLLKSRLPRATGRHVAPFWRTFDQNTPMPTGNNIPQQPE